MAADCRAILPLSAVLVVCDCLLSERVRSWAEVNLPSPVGCLVGGKRHTQCLDVAHTAHLVIEKGLDDHSAGAITTFDIRRFYDSINPVRVARFLISRGMDPGTVAACVRVQSLPIVYICAFDQQVPQAFAQKAV